LKIVARDGRYSRRTSRAAAHVAIDGVNLEVVDKEFIALLGPSGCGKSSFLYVLGGFLRATSGEVLIDGRPITGPGPDRGIVFQHYALFPWRTVLGNVTYGLEELGIPKAERLARAKSFIDLVKLTGSENAYPNRLSGGMRQRVALARTLATNPDVLLMDEPFGALDAQTRRIMQEELLEIWHRTKKTVIFVTHDVQEAVYLADRVVVMTAAPGRIRTIVKSRSASGRERSELVEELWAHIRAEVEHSDI
jgi:NitT/TauT family transport system ATP-binding protein